MPNLAQITIAGHIGRDAETKQVNDTTVTEFSVAVNDRQDNTMWFRVSVWGRYGEVLLPMLTKGKVVTVIGDFTIREYINTLGEARNSHDIRANSVIVADGGQAGNGRSVDPASGNDTDDIPF